MESMIEIEGNFGKRLAKISGGHAQIVNIDEALEMVEKTDSSNETVSQLFNAARIAGKTHLLHASKLALEAFESGESFADSPKIELTCWAAGLRQINKALDRVGVKEDSDKIAVITIGKEGSKVTEAQETIFRELDMERDEGVLEITEKKMNNLQGAFSISQAQLEVSSLKNIILEKIALLGLER